MIAILPALGEFVAQSIGILTKIAPKVLPWIVEGAKKLITILEKNLPLVMDVIDSVTDIADIIDRNKVNSEEIGIRSLKAEKSPENFEDIQSYIIYLQEEIEVDKKEYTKAEILTHKAIGGTILITGLEEKLNINTSPEFWLEAARNKLKKEEIVGILQKYSQEGISLDIVDYCKGKLTYSEEKSRGEMLVNIFSSLNPEKSIDEIENRVMKLEGTTQNKSEVEEYDI